MTEAEEALYWNAFGARLAAFGMAKVFLRGLTLSGYKEQYGRLNEFLRKEMPEFEDDEKAVTWYETIWKPRYIRAQRNRGDKND